MAYARLIAEAFAVALEPPQLPLGYYTQAHNAGTYRVGTEVALANAVAADRCVAGTGAS